MRCDEFRIVPSWFIMLINEMFSLLCCDKILRKNKNVHRDVCLNFLLRVPYLLGVIANIKQKRGVVGGHNNGDSLGRTSYL